MYFLFFLALAYVLGSIPFGVVLTRWRARMDITKVGSGNIGATNVMRQAGPALGIATLACDMAKGALPVLGMMLVLGEESFLAQTGIALVALAAFLGHLFPLYSLFKQGGKGVATAAGCFLILSPLALAGALLAFATAVGISRRASVGSLTAAASLAPLVYWRTHSVAYTAAAFAVAVLVWFKHEANIKRLLAGEEPRIF
ncbi:MAG: glycerol-3-phosphate 1-O-acyltransferase PlsY [Desulfatibacillum sp.]|nr:glycerol-3-phosphate 1-O-acyltransferase PlsY [Desulfatibacillum sp.]